MTTYTAIPTTDIDGESPIDEAVLTLLRDNPISMIEGDPTAPSFGSDVVDTTQIVAAAVGRSEIASSTTTSAGALNLDSIVDISLNDWALFPMVHISSNLRDCSMGGHTTDGAGASNPRFQILNASSSFNETYDIDHRWIIAA